MKRVRNNKNIYTKGMLIVTLVKFVISVILLFIAALHMEDISNAYNGLGVVAVFMLLIFSVTYIIRIIRIIVIRVAIKKSGILVVESKPTPKETFTDEQIKNYWNQPR